MAGMLLKGASVLFVDADTHLADSLADGLKRCDVSLVHANTVAGALTSLCGLRTQAHLSHVLMTLDLPDGPGELVLEATEAWFPQARVMAMAHRVQGPRALSLVGRCTYVPRTGVTADGLLEALERIAAPGIRSFVEENALSAREHAVLLCMIEGLTMADTAERLRCKPSTVKTFVERMYDKTGRSSRTELLGFLVEWLTSTEIRRSLLTRRRAPLSAGSD